jgi:hypothetical protein
MESYYALHEEHALKASTYEQAKNGFCINARKDANSRNAPFNVLEIEEVERSTPNSISTLVSLFERLGVSLAADRDAANAAIHAAQEANAEAMKQLASLIDVAKDNLDCLRKVMGNYKSGCFNIKVQLANNDRIQEILAELKEKMSLITVESGVSGLRGSEETRLKQILRETLIDKVFIDPSVTFINGGIWQGKESHVNDKLSTGQKVALEFMWIVRQAEYEIERGLREMTRKEAARSRVKANRVILVDGIFSTLSDRGIIRDALDGLRDLGGNFQIIGFLHSSTWTNDYDVFPVYHVGKKLLNRSGSGLISFTEKGRDNGTLGFFSSVARSNAIAA